MKYFSTFFLVPWLKILKFFCIYPQRKRKYFKLNWLRGFINNSPLWTMTPRCWQYSAISTVNPQCQQKIRNFILILWCPTPQYQQGLRNVLHDSTVTTMTQESQHELWLILHVRVHMNLQCQQGLHNVRRHSTVSTMTPQCQHRLRNIHHHSTLSTMTPQCQLELRNVLVMI